MKGLSINMTIILILMYSESVKFIMLPMMMSKNSMMFIFNIMDGLYFYSLSFNTFYIN